MSDHKKYNDSKWLKYGYDYDDLGLQTYFDSPIIWVRFWESKNGNAFYDVLLEEDYYKPIKGDR